MTCFANVPADISRRNFLLGRRAPQVEGPKTAFIQAHCLAQQGVVCRTCGEVCEENAIRFTPRLGGVAIPLLDPTRCTACGECVTDCPNSAIELSASRMSANEISINETATTETHNNTIHKGDL